MEVLEFWDFVVTKDMGLDFEIDLKRLGSRENGMSQISGFWVWALVVDGDEGEVAMRRMDSVVMDRMEIRVFDDGERCGSIAINPLDLRFDTKLIKGDKIACDQRSQSSII